MPLLNTKDSQKALCKEIKTILGDSVTNVIVAEQSAPRVKNPYVAFKMLGINQLGSASYRENKDQPGLFDLTTDNEVLITFTAYGATSKDIIAKLMFFMYNDQLVIDRLLDIGFTVKGSPNLIDQSKLLETKFEQRSKVDMEFFMSITHTVDWGTIETVNLDSCYVGGAESNDPVHENSQTITSTED